MEIFYNILSNEIMGGNIPKPIKVNVLRKWLQGKSRDQISKEEEIGTGTVSSIIKECRENDTEFDLMRQIEPKVLMTIYFPCRKEKCKLQQYIRNWFNLFVDYHNNKEMMMA